MSNDRGAADANIPLLTDIVTLGTVPAPKAPAAAPTPAPAPEPSASPPTAARATPLKGEVATADLDAFYARLQGDIRQMIDAGIERATTQVASVFIGELRGQLEALLSGLNAHPATAGGRPAAQRADTAPDATPSSDSTSTMDKTYNPAAIEQRWYETWERNGYFAPGGDGPAYCIMLPPPNVTGTLHMGHAFNNTIMDALTRYHRMHGRNTLWQPGTDHAGIATQMVVERQLGLEGKSRLDLGREAFLARVWQWKEQSGNTIQRQLRRLGSSLDWSRDRFTMDDGLSNAVTEVFVRLYDDRLIYRGKRLVNWDPVLHTAISDLEVINTEEAGSLWHIRYPLADGSGHLVVATTRPETLLGDTAVAVHPTDPRYQGFIGKQVQLPLTGRTIPVIADPYVDPEFGTGCLKITPAHDFNDYEVGRRHDLPVINIFTIDAALNENAPAAYVGLDRFEARRRVVADLEAQGLIERIDAHKLMVPRGDRTHAVIEPYLTDQWYVKIQPLAAPAIAAVENGDIRFVPENWSKTYFEWMRNIEDWCISRQLWWGHRIPAWYDAQGTVYVGRTEADVRTKHALSAEVALTQDEDVLDTWFSSALWPFSTLGWPEQTPALRTFYPTSVLVTGFDIIFFWVARMIMMGLKFMGQVPFKEVYIHGLVRDAEGRKMSKTLGNILDPIDLIDGIDLETLVAKRTTGLMQPKDAPKIEKATRKQFPDGIQGYGVDALRFAFASLATQGRDIRFDLGRIEGYRNFCNKIWNAARYVLMSIGDEPLTANPKDLPLGLAERWILTRFAQTTGMVIEGIETYRFDLASHAIYEFTWDEYCDWYLEASKSVLTDPNATVEEKLATRTVLIHVLEQLLRLQHPFMPFITEEIWQRVAERRGIASPSIMLQRYPSAPGRRIDEEALIEFEWVKTFVLGVRRIRAEMNIAPGKTLPVLVQYGSAQEHEWLRAYTRYLKGLARIETPQLFTATDSGDMAAALAGEMTILIPLADLIDRDAELKRLGNELAKLRQDHDRIQAKLANQNYVERAPAEVVAKERQRSDETAAAIARLEEQVSKIEALKDSQ